MVVSETTVSDSEALKRPDLGLYTCSGFAWLLGASVPSFWGIPGLVGVRWWLVVERGRMTSLGVTSTDSVFLPSD